MMLSHYFKFQENNTSLRQEVIAGITTFLTMAYIILVNPQILGDAGMPMGAVFVATCLAAAFGSLLMGLYANYPIALAPSMGLNVYFTYSVVKGLGYDWHVTLAAVFISGVLFFILTLCQIRQWIIEAIPHCLKIAIAAGIGLFLGVIALKNMGMIDLNAKTFMHFVWRPDPLWGLFLLGLVLIVICDHKRIPGALLIGIFTMTGLGIALGLSQFRGICAMPPSLLPTWLALDVKGALHLSLWVAILTFFFVALIDSTATLVGLAHLAGFINKENDDIPRINRVLMSDSLATIAGSLLGTSTIASYIESAAGIRAGGRTGLTSVVVGLLFLLSLFLSPLADTIPAYATAPALFFVAILMFRGVRQLAWHDVSEWLPSLITVFAIPLTFSIAKGVSLGFISYIVSKLLFGKAKSLNAPIVLLGIIFLSFLLA